MYLLMRITTICSGLTILFSIMSCVGTTYVPEPVIEGQTELHKATTRARAMKLLSKGAAINAQNAFGNTPLHEAIYLNRKEVIDCLLAQGADYTIANAKGISGRDLMLQNISYQDLVKRYDLGQPSEQATAGQVRDISDKATPVIELSPDMKTSTEALETEISGRVSDPSGMDAFFIDNIRVSLFPSGQFLKKVALAVGNNSFHLKAVDRQGKETVQTVSILRQAVGDALWSSPVPAAQLHGEKRVALIIGNSAYRSSPLRNPVNDAVDLGRMLKTLGFDTDIQTNADKRDMLSAIDRFDRQLQDADVGLFFYAGHGMQVSGLRSMQPSFYAACGEYRSGISWSERKARTA